MRRYLIIGASGTFGRALIEQLSRETDTEVIAVGRDPIRLAELVPLHPRLSVRVGDILHLPFLTSLARTGADFIVHAAALKHVGLGEIDPWSYLQVNVLGLLNVCQAFAASQARKLFLSTDKAVQPVNFYGLTKAMGERLWPWLTLRLGNVMDARGGILTRWLRGERRVVYQPTPTRFVLFSWEVVRFARALLEGSAPAGIYVPTPLSAVDVYDLALACGGAQGSAPLPTCEKQHEFLTSPFERRIPAGIDGLMAVEKVSAFAVQPLSSATAPRISGEEVIRVYQSHR